MKTKVLLKEDMDNLGKVGDVVEVASGYARNSLLPRGLAVRINPSALMEIEALKKRKTVKDMELKREFEEVASRLKEVSVEFVMRTTEAGTLYGSVHDHDIAEKLAEKSFKLENRMIQMEAPIKVLGEHRITIKLHPEVSAEILAIVKPSDEKPVTREELEAEKARAAMGEEDDGLRDNDYDFDYSHELLDYDPDDDRRDRRR